MPTYTFTNFDSDGDLSNADNWNLGGSPAGVVPASGDLAILDGQTVTQGTCAADVISATSATLSGGSLAGAVSASGATFSGITCSQNINIVGCTVTADPGGGITSSGGCQFTGTFTSAITDTGGTFNATSYFYSPVNSSGGSFNATFNVALTATGATIIGGTYTGSGNTFTGCTITGGTINYGTVTGGTITGNPTFASFLSFSGLTFDSSFTGGVDHDATCANCSIQAGSFIDVTCSGDVSITGGRFSKITVSSATSLVIGTGVILAGTASLLNITVPVADYPAAPYVYTGTLYANGNRTGTLTLPTSTQVRSGITFGIGGNSITGIAVIPATTDVRNGVNVGTSHGSLVVPSAGTVQSGVTFDNGTTGTLAFAASRIGCSMIQRRV